MKNLLFTFSMLMATSSLLAQLYVAPNDNATPGDPSDDTNSYVYVDDQILFVTQDVNLNVNTVGTNELASIYLRNESQLIQGDPTVFVPNSGDGLISVYQDSNSDSYDYNYWSSPVGAPTPGISGNRVFGLKRFFQADNLTASTQMIQSNGLNSTGDGDGSGSALNITRKWYYKFNPVTQAFVKGGSGHNLVAGEGFIMKGTNITTTGDGTTAHTDFNNQQYDFRGRPNNGDIAVTVQRGNVAGTQGEINRFALTGNPYPSALDLNLLITDASNAGLIDNISYWDEDRSINSHLYADNKGGYGTWVPGADPYGDGGNYVRPTFLGYNSDGTADGSTNGMGPMVERLYAPIGQGFMIKALTNGSSTSSTATVTIKNSHRVWEKESGAFSIFRNNGGKSSNSPDISIDPSNEHEGWTPRIRLMTVYGENSHFRDMLLLFHDTATTGFDPGLDASHPMDAAQADSYFPMENSDANYGIEQLVISTVPYEGINMQVPYGLILETQTKLAIRASQEINLPFKDAYIYDSVANTYQEITGDNQAVLFLEAGNYNDRFFIVFTKNQIAINSLTRQQLTDNVITNIGFFQNNPARQLEVGNPEGFDIKEMNLFDMTGKLVLSKSNLGTINKLTFPTANLSDGVYVIKLTTVDDIFIDHKVSVFNK